MTCMYHDGTMFVCICVLKHHTMETYEGVKVKYYALPLDGSE